MDDALIDQAEQIGLKDAGAYLHKFGKYPTEDDLDHFGFHAEAWRAAWEELQKRGADDGLYDACFEAWRGGFLGPEA
jgi:hypothetical protein